MSCFDSNLDIKTTRAAQLRDSEDGRNGGRSAFSQEEDSERDSWLCAFYCNLKNVKFKFLHIFPSHFIAQPFLKFHGWSHFKKVSRHNTLVKSCVTNIPYFILLPSNDGLRQQGKVSSFCSINLTLLIVSEWWSSPLASLPLPPNSCLFWFLGTWGRFCLPILSLTHSRHPLFNWQSGLQFIRIYTLSQFSLKKKTVI